MAIARNYRPPSMVVHQSFTNNTTLTSIPASVHISGQHANFLTFGSDSEKDGYLGNYLNSSPLTVELPRILLGSVLDTDSAKIILRDALLRYFASTSEKFVIPANARNVISAAQVLQDTGFSFASNGEYKRYSLFGSRDVRIGDTIHVTASIGDETKELWTTVSKLSPRYQQGTVESVVSLGTQNAQTTTAGLSLIYSSDGAPSATASATGNWYDNLLAKGASVANYTATVVIGGDAATTRFRITSEIGDNVGSAALVTGNENEVDLTIGSLTGAILTFDDSETFDVGASYTVTATATYSPAVTVAGGNYNPSYSSKSTKEVSYIVTVTKGGAIPETEPTSEVDKYAAPTLSVTTSDGSDKLPLVRVLQQDGPIQIGRSGVTLQFTGDYLIEGDKYYIECTSPFYDTVPSLILNQNIPADWVQDSNTDVSIELFETEEYISVPEFMMSGQGRLANWSVNNEEGSISIRAGLTLYTPSFKLDGEAVDLPVDSNPSKPCRAFLDARYFVSDLANSITAVTSISELNESVSGPIVPENPLKYAAYYALNNGQGSQVLLTSVTDINSLDAWEVVTDLISERDDAFHIFPLTFGNKAVNDLFYKHVKEMNQDETAKERLLYLLSNDKQSSVLLDSINGNILQGRLSIETGIGATQYAVWEASTEDVDFVTSGVRRGDTIRTDYDYDRNGNQTWMEYTIDEVLNASTLRLTLSTENVVPDQVDTVFEVYRVRTNNEYADLIAETGGYQDMLVRYIYVDNVDPDYPVLKPAASLVGLIGSVVSHQGVSWYPLNAVEEAGWVGKFSNSQLNHMGGNGVLVINRHSDGYVAARHAVTTAVNGKGSWDSGCHVIIDEKILTSKFTFSKIHYVE